MKRIYYSVGGKKTNTKYCTTFYDARKFDAQLQNCKHKQFQMKRKNIQPLCISHNRTWKCLLICPNESQTNGSNETSFESLIK